MSYTNLKQDAAFYARLFMISEAFLVYLGLVISHRVHYAGEAMLPEVMLVTLLTVSLFHVVYSMAGMYDAMRGLRIREEVRRMVLCWLVIVAADGLFAFVTKSAEVVSRLWFGWGVLTAFLLVFLFRLAIRVALARAREKGLNFRSVAIVGSLADANDVIERLHTNRWAGLMPTAVFDGQSDVGTVGARGVSVLGSVEDVYDYVERQRRQSRPIDQVWIMPNAENESKVDRLLVQMEDSSVDLRLVPNFLGLRYTSGMIEDVAEVPVVNLSKVRKDRVSASTKYLLDLGIATAALLFLWPLMLLIAVAIRLDSAGPVLFRQRRYGIDGTEIDVLKFRTMTVSENDDALVVQAQRGDRRVTRIGRLLRRTSLDELPQFVNVLRGEMSVVGPRPHAVSHNETYRTQIDGYMGRHKIKPGITGWAQVNGWRGETDTLDKMENRVRLDIEYINNWSIALDLKIILMTVLKGFRHKNAF